MAEAVLITSVLVESHRKIPLSPACADEFGMTITYVVIALVSKPALPSVKQTSGESRTREKQ